MDALGLLREQAAMADNLLTQVAATITPEQATWHLVGSTTNPIAPTFIHIYFAEDRLVQRAQGQPTLFESGNWQQRLGFNPDEHWAHLEEVDVESMRAYAAAVRAGTQRYLEGLPPAELEREVDSPRGRRKLAVSLSMLLIIHKMGHAGEIAALLGNQGVRGFPF